MCFSATASFGASLGLSVIGIAGLKKVKEKKNLFIAFVPLFFAFQQFCEGLVWYTAAHPSLAWLGNLAKYGFMFFAFVGWPTLLPYAVYSSEAQARRKKILKFFLIAGNLLSAWFLYCLILGRTNVYFGGSLIYVLDFRNQEFLKYLYLGIISIPCVISSEKSVKTVGLLLVVSFLIADIFYLRYFVSIWCFFAALISSWTYVILSRMCKETVSESGPICIRPMS